MTVSRETVVPTWGWLCLTSLWLLPVLLGRGGLAWIGFLMIGIVARRRGWLVAGAAYAVAGIVLVVVDWNGWGDVAAAAVWVVAIVHALVVNPAYLGIMWERRATGALAPTPGRARRAPAAAGRGRRPARPAERSVPPEAEPIVAVADAERGRLLADGAPDAETAGTTGSRAAAAASAAVDVNTASRRALGRLPGMDATRARTVIEERERRGGFADLQEFANVLGLQPHEFARLRDAAFCSPPQRPASTRGRRLDL